MTSKAFVEHSQIRLKNAISKIQSGIWGEEPDGIRDVICLRVADFNRDNFTIDDAKLTLRAVDIKDKLPRLLKKGDLLIEKSGGGDNQPVGTVVYFDKDYEAITSNFLSYLRPSRKVDGRFLCYLFASFYSSRINTKSIKQTTGIQNIDLESYLDEKADLPSLVLQQAIAAYLDKETSHIDALIAKKERQIKLLEEKRQAIITRAVTKGLDPNARMKDSGVEWIGEIPDGWRIWKIAHGVKCIGSGTTPPSNEPGWYSGEIPWITTGELRESYIDKTEKKISAEAVNAFSALIVFPPNSLVIAMYGATIGRVAITKINAATNQACCVLNGGSVFDMEFLFYWFQASRDQIILLASGGGQPNISQEKIRNLRIPCPSIELQKQIVMQIKLYDEKQKTLVGKIRSSISMLKEFRSSLITSAVSGQINVSQEVVK